MINITRIENDLVNQVTVATVEVYEISMGVQRLRDTFYITLQGTYDMNDPKLQQAIYEKFAAINYDIVPGVDPTTVNVVDPLTQEPPEPNV